MDSSFVPAPANLFIDHPAPLQTERAGRADAPADSSTTQLPLYRQTPHHIGKVQHMAPPDGLAEHYDGSMRTQGIANTGQTEFHD